MGSNLKLRGRKKFRPVQKLCSLFVICEKSSMKCKKWASCKEQLKIASIFSTRQEKMLRDSMWVGWISQTQCDQISLFGLFLRFGKNCSLFTVWQNFGLLLTKSSGHTAVSLWPFLFELLCWIKKARYEPFQNFRLDRIEICFAAEKWKTIRDDWKFWDGFQSYKRFLA